jgi:hypothetical protein
LVVVGGVEGVEEWSAGRCVLSRVGWLAGWFAAGAGAVSVGVAFAWSRGFGGFIFCFGGFKTRVR